MNMMAPTPRERVRIEPLLPEHYARLVVQDAQAMFGDLVRPEMFGALAPGEGFAALSGDAVLGIGGTIQRWPGCATGWTIVSAEAGPYWPGLHGAVKRYLEIVPHRRIEITVDCDHAAGHRWARALGFRLEAERMRCYGPSGRDHALYARIRDDG